MFRKEKGNLNRMDVILYDVLRSNDFQDIIFIPSAIKFRNIKDVKYNY